MKWSDRIARGFNPGWGGEERVLPVRRSFWGYRGKGGKVAPDLWAWPADRCANNPDTHFGRHFQGALCDLKPWAILSDHFMVRTCPTKNARRGECVPY
jgi:hypothetical protein